MLIHEYDIKYSRGNLLHLTYHIWHAIIILLHYTALKFRLSISETISINLENQQQQWIYIYIYIYVTNLLALYNSGDLRHIPLTMISNKINPSKKVNENLHKLLKWKKIEKKEQMWKKKNVMIQCAHSMMILSSVTSLSIVEYWLQPWL